MSARVSAPSPGARSRLPLAYLGLAHLSLVLAGAALAAAPQSFVGFYYHPRMLAVVHLVTLGWITGSIVAGLYMIGPLVLRLELPPRRLDTVAFALWALGLTGMVAHFWIDRPNGMAWSAGTAALGLTLALGRAAVAVRRAPAPREIKLHVLLSLLNFAGAATAGVLLAIQKNTPFLPGKPLDDVYAHAHLAALGFATLMVMGFGYRLVPMLLPAATPSGPRVAATAWLLSAGAWGLFAGFLFTSPWVVRAGAVLAAAAIVIFLARVLWMRRHLRPAPAERPLPDWGVWHVAAALACLALATGLGVALALLPDGLWKLRAGPVYGALGLLGFLAQMVLGVNARMLPVWIWMQAYGGRLWEGAPPSPWALAPRSLQAATLALWNGGLLLLLAGLGLEHAALIGTGGAALAMAVVLDAASGIWQLRRTPRLRVAVVSGPKGDHR
ncbi:MAG: hypothetical protein ACM3OB_04200 [Acidobacteriota bacterium]